MTVYIVGAGPGDVELLTVKAAQLCAKAEVVLYDRLVSAEILATLAPWAESICVGKDPNGVSVSQETIHELLIDRAKKSDTVLRLKGGDPFVFGRGAEEAAALRAHGINVEIVPGVTSAIAAPAAAGIAVTQRNVSSAFTVVTGHQMIDPHSGLNWQALVDIGSTLVVLMGAKRAKDIRQNLLASGMRKQMPVAIISSAMTQKQSIKRLFLSELGEQPIANPAVIVIGEVAANDCLSIDIENAVLSPET